MESLVTPGKIRSSKSGVTISTAPDLSLKTKNMLEAPTSTIWSLNNQSTCWKPYAITDEEADKVGA